MRLSNLTWGFALLCSASSLIAQNPIPADQILLPSLPKQLFQETGLSSQLQPTLQQESSKGLLLISEEFESLRQERPEQFSLFMPMPDGSLRTLNLHQFDVRSEDFEAKVTDETGNHAVSYESGIVAYELINPDESGVLILMADHVVASFQTENEQYEINPRNEEGLHAIFNVADAKSQPTFSCALDDVAALQTEGGEPAAMQAMLNPACLEMAIDIDQYTYQQLGFDVQTAVDWALATLSAVDQIYRSELLDNSAGTEIVTLQALSLIHI